AVVAADPWAFPALSNAVTVTPPRPRSLAKPTLPLPESFTATRLLSKSPLLLKSSKTWPVMVPANRVRSSSRSNCGRRQFDIFTRTQLRESPRRFFETYSRSQRFQNIELSLSSALRKNGRWTLVSHKFRRLGRRRVALAALRRPSSG